MGIEARRDDDQVGPKILEARQDARGERLAEALAVGAGLQGRVDDRVVIAGFRDRTRAGIERHLVGRAEQHRGIGPEDVLAAVAVVHVPIDDGDAVYAVHRPGMAGGHRSVVEQAEAHGAGALGMVSRRPHGREGVPGLACHHRVDPLNRGTDATQHAVDGPGRQHRVGIDVDQSLRGRRRHHGPHPFLRMGQRHGLQARRLRSPAVEGREGFRPEGLLDRLHPLGTLRMSVRGPVPEGGIMAEQDGHAALPGLRRSVVYQMERRRPEPPSVHAHARFRSRQKVGGVQALTTSQATGPTQRKRCGRRLSKE